MHAFPHATSPPNAFVGPTSGRQHPIRRIIARHRRSQARRRSVPSDKADAAMRAFLDPLAGPLIAGAVNLVSSDAGGRPRQAARRGLKFRTRVDNPGKCVIKLVRVQCSLG
eukprot:3523816-Pyramimonas_sp.AAC.1